MNMLSEHEQRKLHRAGSRTNLVQDFLSASHRVGNVALTASALAVVIPNAQSLVPAGLALYASTGVLRETARHSTRALLERTARRRSEENRNLLAVAYQTMALIPISERTGGGLTRRRILLTALLYASRSESPLILGGLTHEAGPIMSSTPARRVGAVRNVALKLAARAEQAQAPLERAQWRLALWNATARVSEALALSGDRTSQYHDACREAITAFCQEYSASGPDGADRAARELHTAFPESNVMALYAEALHRTNDQRAGYMTTFANDSDPRKICAWTLIGGDRDRAPSATTYEAMMGAIVIDSASRNSST